MTTNTNTGATMTTARWTKAELDRTPRAIRNRLGGYQQQILLLLVGHLIYPVSRTHQKGFVPFTHERKKAMTALFCKGLIEWSDLRYEGPCWDYAEQGPPPVGRCIRMTQMGHSTMVAIGWDWTTALFDRTASGKRAGDLLDVSQMDWSTIERWEAEGWIRDATEPAEQDRFRLVALTRDGRRLCTGAE